MLHYKVKGHHSEHSLGQFNTIGLTQGGHQFNLRHRLNCSMDVTIQFMVLARSHGSLVDPLVDLLSTKCAVELN
jgi:hypothetical protein